MSDTEKPQWWRDLPATATITMPKEEFLAVLQAAVSTGRVYWDSYYGYNEDFHVAVILNAVPEWKDRFK